MTRVNVLILMPRDYRLLPNSEPFDRRRDALVEAIEPICAKYDTNTPVPHREPIDPDEVEDTRNNYENGTDDGVLRFSKMNPDWHRNLVAAQAFMRHVEPKAETTLQGVKGVSHIELNNPEGYFSDHQLSITGRFEVRGTTAMDRVFRMDGSLSATRADAFSLADVNWTATRDLQPKDSQYAHVVIDARDPEDVKITSGRNLRWWGWDEGRTPADWVSEQAVLFREAIAKDRETVAVSTVMTLDL